MERSFPDSTPIGRGSYGLASPRSNNSNVCLGGTSVTPSTLVENLSWFVGRGRAEELVAKRLLALICAGCAITTGAYAQEAQQQVELEEVTVTGTRLVRDGANAPTPVTVVSSERLTNLGATNIGQVLSTLPSFRATTNPQTSGIQPKGAGSSLADLRGLGATRTLVLVNGKRFVPSTFEGTVDLNQVPTLLIDRTEIVTGGASAAYGSDAVAGVVNLMLDADLQGVRTQLQYGQTERGDGETYTAAIAGGTSFMGERGHTSLAFEYEDSNGTGDCYTRDWCAEEYQVITAGAGRPANQPANNILPHAHTVVAVPGGLISAVNGTSTTAAAARSVLVGTSFRADGTPYAFQYGTKFAGNSTFMQGGEGYNGYIGAPLMVTPTTRSNVFSHTVFDLTDTVKSSLDLSFGRAKSHGRGAQTRDMSGLTLAADNPYLPAATRSALTSAGVPLTSATTFNLGRMGDDFGYTDNRTQSDVYRALIGFDGELSGSWSWDISYQYGGVDYDQVVGNNRIQEQVIGTQNPGSPSCSATATAACTRIQLAADATTAPNGTIVCRSTLTNPNNGCVPVNLFGLGNYSDAAYDYLYGTSYVNYELTQQAADANVRGDLFSTWAGVVPLAVGLEYRRLHAATTADPATATSGFYVYNTSELAGTVEVKEAYLETAVPLLADLPFAKSLELNGAVRVTDYNTSGNVTTWKYGVVYEPVDWLRLRATKSKDIRAPNTDELYRGNSTSFVTVDGQLTTQISGGNPDLLPEEADTFTAGLSLRGMGMFEGFRASVDYYDIEIADAISTLTAQTTVNRCRNEGLYCDRITFTGTTPSNIRVVSLNLNLLETSGVDIELGYNLPLSLFSSTPGTLDFSILATHVDHLTTTDSSGLAIDRAGVTGNNVSGGGAGVPNWQVNGLVTYATEPVTVTMEARFIEDGLFDATLYAPNQPNYNPAASSSINRNHVASAVYFNLGATYKFTGTKDSDVEVFAGIQNLLDRDPPVAPSSQGSTNMILFDPLGRAYRLGVRASF